MALAVVRARLARAVGRLSARPEVATSLLLIVAVVLGCALRFAFWSGGRSFWVDEVLLALNVTTRSLPELARPLDHDQGAPFGFLALVKLCHLTLGDSERALRLVPLLSGLAAMLVFPRLARCWLSPAGAVVATTLFAVSPRLISYSAEFKQYSTDVLVALVILTSAASCLAGTGSPRWVRLATVGMAAVWFSHSALFVLAAVGFALLWQARAERRSLLPVFLLGGFWLLSFGLCWWLCLRDLSKNPYLLNFWAEYFAPVVPRGLDEVGWYFRSVIRLFDVTAGITLADVPAGVPATVLFGVGVVALWPTRPAVALVLVGPLLAALIASALGQYPFGGRLMLFCVPLLCVGFGAGFAAVAESPRGVGRAVAGCLGVMVVATAFGAALQQAIRPRLAEDNRSAIRFIADHWRPGDRVLLSSQAREPWLHYAERTSLRDQKMVVGRFERDDWDSISSEVKRASGDGRVWVFATHERDANLKMMAWQLDAVGRRIRQFSGPGVHVFLYDTGLAP